MNLGIQHLISSLQKLQYGGVYFVSVSSKDLALQAGLSCLAENSFCKNLRYLTLQGIELSQIKSQNFSEEFLSKIKAHVYEYEDNCDVPRNIINDLVVYDAIDTESLHVVLFEDSQILELDKDNLNRYLSKISYFAKKHNAVFLFVIYGSDPDIAVTPLLEHSTNISGIATIEQNLTSVIMNTRLWRLDDGGFTSGVNTLKVTANGLELVIDEKTNTAHIDENICYVVANSFTPDIKNYSDTKVFASNYELYEQAIKESYCSTVFFTLENREDIDTLAKMIYELRTIRGKELKIIIIEKIPGIRATSEKLLLNCGANFIFPSSAKGYYINAMIPTLKTSKFTQSISVNFNRIIDNYHFIENEDNGYLKPEEFFNSVDRLLKAGFENNYVEACLSVLTPKNGIDSLSCLSQFTPKRGGDYCTLVNGNIILFLPNCRNGELKIALEHTFNTAPSVLFESDESYFNKRDILSKIQYFSSQKIKSTVDEKVLAKLIQKQKQAKAVAQKEISLMSLAKSQHHEATLTDISALNNKGE